MKYYLIVGEASGDLHASQLMRALKNHDKTASFRFFGGDLMAAEGGTLVRHYRQLAYMGFIPVLLHLPTIFRNMAFCKDDIRQWQPDVVILVDYPGFNLNIAKYVHAKTHIPVYYYIAPKIWAWKEYRIKNIRRDVDELFSILPFEIEFFEQKHHYPIHYVGNPTADEVRQYLAAHPLSQQHADGCSLPPKGEGKPVIALLAGSRRQEISDNLPAMIEATRHLTDRYRLVLAGAPSIEEDYYRSFIGSADVQLVQNQTYPLLARAHAAIVTSGTATLETALFGVPQVVCYRTAFPRFIGFMRKKVLKVPFVSLVNLIADREVVRELVADTFSVDNIRAELHRILEGPDRQQMLAGYDDIRQRLGDAETSDNAARLMCSLLTDEHRSTRQNG